MINILSLSLILSLLTQPLFFILLSFPCPLHLSPLLLYFFEIAGYCWEIPIRTGFELRGDTEHL